MQAKLLTLCMALCAVCITATSQNVPDYVPSDGLVAWYPFNGNANDESGNGNDGENEGAILHENRFFESASAYFFSESDFISLPLIAVSTSFSASFWISPVEGSTGSDAILDGGQGKYIRIVPSLVSEDWRLGYNSECIGNPTATSEFSLNSWVHGALIFDGDSLHFFQDGVKQNSMEHCASDWSFQFIGFADNGEHGFDGVIDDLGIWDRTLTEEEVLAVYNAQLPFPGCIDTMACNFNAEANNEDGSCVYPLFGEDCETGGAACGEGTIWDANIQACIVSDFCQEDLDGDGAIGVTDLMQLLSLFGTDCPIWMCGDPVNYDGYDYATVQIGEQCWFAENLRTDIYTNGDVIAGDLSDAEWATTNSGAQATYNNDPAMLNDYGRFYNWHAVDDSRGLCPTEWNLPTHEEFNALTEHVGGTQVAGGALKASVNDMPEWNGTNDFGFNAKPTGYRNNDDGVFLEQGETTIFWASTNAGASSWYRMLQSYTNWILAYSNGYVTNGYTVRCLKDTE